VTDSTQALLRAVLDDPDDLASRRVYGDALIDAGNARGELINVQCDLSTTTAADPRFAELLKREGQLLAEHEKAWLAPLKGIVWRPQFTRGFLEKIFVNTKNFIPAAPELLAREPVTSIHLRELTQANASKLGSVEGLERLHTFRVVESKLNAKAVEALFTERLTRLRHLNLYQAGIDDACLPHLEAAVFPRLERLTVSGTRLTYDGLERLLASPALAKLGYLGLMWLLPGTDGSSFLAEHLDLPKLTHVDLGSSNLSNDDLRILAGNATFQRLRGLRLENNNLGMTGAIDALTPLRHLEVLDLSTNDMNRPACAALAELPLPLRVLRLYQCSADDDWLEALARAKFPLKHLDLGYGGISEKGITAIAKAGWPLEKLELWACKIRDEGANALADADFTATLRELVIGYNDLTDVGVLALASGNWPRLERIVFRGDAITARGVRALAASSKLPALRSIKFEDMKIPKAALKPLVERGVRIE